MSNPMNPDEQRYRDHILRLELDLEDLLNQVHEEAYEQGYSKGYNDGEIMLSYCCNVPERE